MVSKVLLELSLSSLWKDVLGTVEIHFHSSPLIQARVSLVVTAIPVPKAPPFSRSLTVKSILQEFPLWPVPEHWAFNTCCPSVPILLSGSAVGSGGSRAAKAGCDDERLSYRRALCRPLEAYAHCRTGSVHGESCWRWGPCRSQRCSSSLCHTLRGKERFQKKRQDSDLSQTAVLPSCGTVTDTRVACWGKQAGTEGKLETLTCVWDQEVHHFNSVKVDHHATTIRGRMDKEVTNKLWNRVQSPRWWHKIGT